MNNPIKPTLKTEILPIILIVLSFVGAFYFYAHFPERVPTHWGINGQVDGWSSAGFAAFFFPILNMVMYLSFLLIPLLDPRKERYAEFAKVYHIFKDIILVFMTVVFLMLGVNGLGYNMPIGLIMPVMVGLLFIIIGNYMGKFKSNFTIGTRNMWTLSNENVWNKSNRLSGKVFIVGGLMMAITSFLPESIRLIWFGIIIAGIVLIPSIYSYMLYLQEQRNSIVKK